MKTDVTIVGGGIAGLAVGALLAKAGYGTVVLEKGNQPGGRAYTFKEKGFTLNYGPHAMYRPHSGMLGEVLGRLGRPPIAHGYPDPLRSYWSMDGRLAALGAKPHQLLMTKLFPPASRLRLAQFMLAIRGAKPERLGDITWGAWLDHQTADPLIRRFGAAFGTVNTYTRPSRELSARFLLGHLQRSLFAKDYVGYMSGGWATMYDIFIDEIRAHGGEVVTAARVDLLDVRGGAAVAAVAGGARYEADAFVCALPPQDMPAIVESGSALGREVARWSGMEDVRALCMDLGFSRRVRTDSTFVYEVDTDLYYSLHSEVTPDLAPDGGQLLHAMAYLSPEEAADARLLEARRQQLVGGLDRYLPERAMPQRSLTTPNVYFAGDARDLPYDLGEESLASALDVADAIARDFARSGAPAQECVVV